MTSPSLTVTPDELQRRLGGDVVVFDCRFSLNDPGAGRRAYAAGHVPGAFHLDMERDLSGAAGSHGGRHPLPEAAAFTARLQACGVDAGTTVVTCDDNRYAGAARAWWLLQYFGHRRACVLDGGYAGWLAAGGESSREPSTARRRGSFVAVADAAQVVDYDTVRRSVADGSPTLVDAREAERYRGDVEPIDPRAGHIPGAHNRCWLDASDPDGRLLPAEAQRARWADLADDAAPVVYCGSGVTATVNLLSLRLAGVRGARLYAGSWSDWCSYPDSPIRRGAE